MRKIILIDLKSEQIAFGVPEHLVAKQPVCLAPFYDRPVLFPICNSACHCNPPLAFSSNGEEKSSEETKS